MGTMHCTDAAASRRTSSCCELRRMNTLQQERLISVQADAIEAMKKNLLLTLRKFSHAWEEYEQSQETHDARASVSPNYTICNDTGALNLIESMRDLMSQLESSGSEVQRSSKHMIPEMETGNSHY